MNFFVILFREIAVRLLRKHYKIIWNNLTITISSATKRMHSTTKNMHLNQDEIDQLNYKQCNQDFLQQQLILSLRNQASEGSARITGMTMLNGSDAALASCWAGSFFWTFRNICYQFLYKCYRHNGVMLPSIEVALPHSLIFALWGHISSCSASQWNLCPSACWQKLFPTTEPELLYVNCN